MEFRDRAPLEKVRRLSDGRLAAVSKVARSGVYQYAGAEVGRPDLSVVNVYRPESEVFDQVSLASFAHKAVTLDHPAEAVTADNWRKHSVGYTEGKIVRDGDYIEIPLMLADATAVAAVENGTANELSAGYSCELVWRDGIAPSGERYQAQQTDIRANHIALVARARAGSKCRIGDTVSSDAKSTEPGTIDEALRQRFAELAKQQGTTVPEMLASMQQAKIEEVASEVAKAFISARAGHGVASQFATDAFMTDAEMDGVIALARERHRVSHAYMGDHAPPFTPQHIADAITAAQRQKLAMRSAAAGYAADAVKARAEHEAAYATEKAGMTNAWRRNV